MIGFTCVGPFGPIECIVEKNRGLDNAVLIMSHGFRGSRDSGGRATKVAYAAAANCDVVRYNFTGTRVISSQVEELKAVIDAVRRQKPGCRIHLLGRSLGGAASMITAYEDGDIASLILWATPNDLRETFRHVMLPECYERLDAGETLHFKDERGECALTPDFLTDADKNDLSAILKDWGDIPVLMLHCSGDEVVSVEQAKRNAEILGKKGTLKIFEGGDHSFENHTKDAAKVIAKWIHAHH